ncbi:hypothetical protein VNO78_26703 [Psophocarpus tetragonolobus]|uniref:Uncharacterized protein n=1 Tax=Psophocarpus tetragonolobus TaxID=3891 RepID=A0AAN9XA29_PSOTE
MGQKTSWENLKGGGLNQFAPEARQENGPVCAQCKGFSNIEASSVFGESLCLLMLKWEGMSSKNNHAMELGGTIGDVEDMAWNQNVNVEMQQPIGQLLKLKECPISVFFERMQWEEVMVEEGGSWAWNIHELLLSFLINQLWWEEVLEEKGDSWGVLLNLVHDGEKESMCQLYHGRQELQLTHPSIIERVPILEKEWLLDDWCIEDHIPRNSSSQPNQGQRGAFKPPGSPVQNFIFWGHPKLGANQ